MAKSGQKDNIVINLFEEQLGKYTERSDAHTSRIVGFLIEHFEKTGKTGSTGQPLKICEFGGAGGNLLKELHNSLGDGPFYYNVELVDKYCACQALESIRFKKASLLDSGFEDNSFDVIIVRHLLHHLIGKSLRQTHLNQALAISELFRMVKPGGAVLIEEQVNCSRFACRLIYHLSRFSSRIGFRNRSFDITPHTIIGYLTLEELKSLCRKHVPSENWLVSEYKRWNYGLHWKLTFMMRNTGPAFLAIQKPQVQSG